MLNSKEIIDRIELIRKTNELTASSFATKIGVQRSSISHILSGRNRPSLDFLIKIFTAFDDISLDWLILGKSHTFPPVLKKAKPIDKLEKKILNNDEIGVNKLTNDNKSVKEIIYIYEDGRFEIFIPKI